MLGAVTLVVPDYDSAIAWFVEKLGLVLREDTDLGNGKRWVRLGFPGGGSDLLLARAVGVEQLASIGKAAGGRVAFFLRTDNFDQDYQRMKAAGVAFAESPRIESYGKVAVFADAFGNKWDLVEAA